MSSWPAECICVAHMAKSMQVLRPYAQCLANPRPRNPACKLGGLLRTYHALHKTGIISCEIVWLGANKMLLFCRMFLSWHQSERRLEAWEELSPATLQQVGRLLGTSFHRRFVAHSPLHDHSFSPVGTVLANRRNPRILSLVLSERRHTRCIALF
jgi:hypothetical protein